MLFFQRGVVFCKVSQNDVSTGALNRQEHFFHRCGFGSYTTYHDDSRFESSPGRLPILKNTYTYDPQSIFCRNHKFAYAADFVGSGDCGDVNDCLALLAGAGRKFNVTAEYHTTSAYYPGFPV